MHARLRLRQIVNVVNFSTPLGIVVAWLGGAHLARGPDGLILGRGYHLPLPAAPAFTVGNVVILKIDDDQLARRPRLLVHEGRHASQYAVCLGVCMLPLYLLAAAWSWLRCRDFSSRNVFERLAGLADGGYGDPRRRAPEDPAAISQSETRRGGEGRSHGS